MIIKNSKSISEVLRKLEMRIAGGNSLTIKKYIEKYNINLEHFDIDELRVKNLRKYLDGVKIPIEEILIEGSTYNNGTHLKRRILDDKLIEYKCVDCSNIGEWNGKSITLQLDHINGINDDNRLENLRFMCPNCHSQTETYAGKNKK
jgi:5-methylcytosine-specific restriction endonuclease McrA